MQMTRSEIHALYDRYGHVVFHRCRTILGDEQEARDAMQEVFVRLMKNVDQFRGEASPLTWLYRVSTNLCLNRVRDHRARARKLAEPDPSADTLPGMSAFAGIDPERRNLVRSLLDRIDDETRAIVIYYFVDEMTLEEIAALVDLSVPTVRKRIQHFQGVARRTLSLRPAGAGIVLWFLLHPVASAGTCVGTVPALDPDRAALDRAHAALPTGDVWVRGDL
jgi:RNA polymerase sigma-70 factor (ECF subfamily)